MSRLLRIAAREYLSYVRTVGFWLSLALLPVVLTAAVGIPIMMERSSPTPRLAIVDLTGERLEPAVAEALADGGKALRPPVLVVAAPAEALAATSPAEAGRALRRAMAQGAGRRIDAAAVISGKGDKIAIDLWTLNPNDNVLQALLRDRFNEVVRRQQLVDAGVAPAVIAAAERVEPTVTIYSPKAEGGRVSIRDRLPAVVGAGMGLLLWSVIMTGAGILLNSVIEEKSNRILEVLLSSASTAEIMGGKILGVAGVTGTVLGVWITVGATALALRAPDMGAGVVQVLLEHGLIVYFALFLVMGYLMYASIFAAVGAFCETSRDAQTLLGPIMLILMVPILFMSQAIVHPDAPILTVLSWIPPFTPFLMVARVASGPPLWQIIGTLLMMAATSAVVVWIAGRAFRAGALSFGKVDRKAIFAMIAARR